MALKYGNLAIPLVALALVSFYFRSASTRAERRMESMALTDPLTGLLNRRSMEQRLREAAHGFQRSGRAFSLVMADVDHFKRVNDVHGHAVGDRVLARGGGAVHRTAARARRRRAVGRRGVPVAAARDGRGDGVRGRGAAARRGGGAAGGGGCGIAETVTMTFGVAMFERGMRVGECLKRADEALYAGKAAGRNRVVGAA